MQGRSTAAAVVAFLALAPSVALAASDFVDPGSMEAQSCKGTVSGGYSGVITHCGLVAELLGGTITYTFRFRVRYASGIVHEGGLLGFSRTLGEPTTGRLTHTAFEMGATGHVGIPTPSGTDRCSMLYGERGELNYGSIALDLSRVPRPEGEGGYLAYGWFGGSIRMDLPPVPGLPGDPCPGVTVEAVFKPGR